MILLFSILVALSGNINTTPFLQEENKAYGYAHVTMADDITVLSTVFTVELDQNEQSVVRFKLDNTNKFISFCMNRPDIEYNPKIKVESGTLIELSFNKDELYESYKKKKALSNDKFFVVEGFEPLVSNMKKRQLIRN